MDRVGIPRFPSVLLAVVQLLHELRWGVSNVERDWIVLFAFDQTFGLSVCFVCPHAFLGFCEVDDHLSQNAITFRLMTASLACMGADKRIEPTMPMTWQA